MKFLLLASFVVLCAASSVYRNKNISINDDGNILITSPSGKRILIARNFGPNGQKNIDIAISGPNIPTKTIKVNDNTLEDIEVANGNTPFSSVDGVSDEYRLKRSSFKSQGDILAEILREYQGVVNEAQYEKLMTRINKAVKKGEISPQIFSLLEELDQQVGQDNVLYGQGVQYGQEGQKQGFYGYNRGYGYNKGYGYQTQQGYNQVPYGNYFSSVYGKQYTPYTRYVNPLLEKVLYNGQNQYIRDLLATQQLGNEGFYYKYGNQIVPSYVRNNPVLYKLLGNQIPYGQIYGTQQTLTVPYVQKIEQLNEVEQAIEQLDDVQQQLQQQQQYGKVAQVQDVIEQLNEVEQQTVQELNGVRQQLYGQNWVQQPYGQYFRQTTGQLRSYPLNFQQLVGQTYGQNRYNSLVYGQQPFYRGYRTYQPTVQGRYNEFYYTVPQVQVY